MIFWVEFSLISLHIQWSRKLFRAPVSTYITCIRIRKCYPFSYADRFHVKCTWPVAFSSHSFTVQHHCARHSCSTQPWPAIWLLYLHLTFDITAGWSHPCWRPVAHRQGWQSTGSRQATSIFSSPPLPRPHSAGSASYLCLASSLPHAVPSYRSASNPFKIKEIALSSSDPSDGFSLHFE